MSLESVLPAGKWTLHSWRSTPKRTRRLIFTRKNDPQLDQSSIYTYLLKQDIYALALEIYVYESNDYSTIYISKADTSGYVKRLNTKHVVAALLRQVVRGLPGNKRVRICLSAKAHGQYLFPNSKENPEKHILTDAQLIKWWIATLDLVLDELENPIARLHIPGLSDYETRAFFPENDHWQSGNVFSRENVWAVRCIPRFEDDPKTRFLHDIVAARRAKKVFCDQFWLELADRQECNINARLGFIGIDADKINKHVRSGVPTLTYDQVSRLKAALMESDFSSRQLAVSSTETLEKQLPDGVEIDGVWVPPKANEKETEQTQKRTINVLQGGLVRKKKKLQ